MATITEVKEFKTIQIPMETFKKIIRKLHEVECQSCYDAKWYWEGMTEIVGMLKPFIGDITDNPSEIFKELNKNIYKYSLKHENEYAKLEDEWSDEPHCQIDGCDRDGEDCDNCPHCYADEYEEPETQFMKLRREFTTALRKKQITKVEQEELIYRWKAVKDNYCLETA